MRDRRHGEIGRYINKIVEMVAADVVEVVSVEMEVAVSVLWWTWWLYWWGDGGGPGGWRHRGCNHGMVVVTAMIVEVTVTTLEVVLVKTVSP